MMEAEEEMRGNDEMMRAGGRGVLKAGGEVF